MCIIKYVHINKMKADIPISVFFLRIVILNTMKFCNNNNNNRGFIILHL